MDHIKTAKQQDEEKPKYNLVCIGSTKDQKNWMILSERVQSEHSWSTAVLTKAPLEIQKKSNKSPWTNLNIKEALFEVVSSYDTNTRKGRNELF